MDKKTALEQRGVGAKRKRETVAELQKLIRAYFENCFDIEYRKVKQFKVMKMPNGKEKIVQYFKVKEKLVVVTPPTVTWLAIACDTCRQTFLNYCDKNKAPKWLTKEQKLEYLDTIKKAKSWVEMYNEERLHKWGSPVGAMFNLKVNFRRQDINQIDHTSKWERVKSISFTTSLPPPDDSNMAE